MQKSEAKPNVFHDFFFFSLKVYHVIFVTQQWYHFPSTDFFQLSLSEVHPHVMHAFQPIHMQC